jgi:hypothetical protein
LPCLLFSRSTFLRQSFFLEADPSSKEQEKKAEPVIETSNPNRDNKTATHIKASNLSKDAKPELSRRER